jgi:hypothetical protein
MSKIVLDGSLGINFDNRGTERLMEVSTEASLRFFKEIAIKKAAIADNELGMFSIGQFDRFSRLRFATFNAPKNLLSSRKNGCAWNPKGKITTDMSEFTGNPVEYNGEQCPDVLYGGCWESLFGNGNAKRDFYATPEGRGLLNELLDLIYLGLGNSVHDLTKWGQHSLITESASNNWYNGDDDEWADYVDQQAVTAGYMTIIDELHDQGVPNFNIPFDTAWVNSTGDFIGNAHSAIDRVLNNLPTKMKLYAKRPTMGGRVRPLIIKVSPQIFEKFETEMIEDMGKLEQAFLYKYNGEFAAQNGFPVGTQMPGVLKYKGHWVVSDDDQEHFDTLTGTITHRVCAVTPSVIGIGFDVPAAGQFEGMGMRVLQRLEAPFQGKIYMDTTFVLGAGILNSQFVANSSMTLTPSA